MTQPLVSINSTMPSLCGSTCRVFPSRSAAGMSAQEYQYYYYYYYSRLTSQRFLRFMMTRQTPSQNDVEVESKHQGPSSTITTYQLMGHRFPVLDDGFTDYSSSTLNMDTLTTEPHFIASACNSMQTDYSASRTSFTTSSEGILSPHHFGVLNDGTSNGILQPTNSRSDDMGMGGSWVLPSNSTYK